MYLYIFITSLLAGAGIWTYYSYIFFKSTKKNYKLFTAFVASLFLIVTYFWTNITMDTNNTDLIKLVIGFQIITWVLLDTLIKKYNQKELNKNNNKQEEDFNE